MYGFAHLHELQVNTARMEASPLDEEVDASMIEARAQQQRRALDDFGLGDIADTVIADVNPTGAFRPRAVATE
jgi:hypothetical protein